MAGVLRTPAMSLSADKKMLGAPGLAFETWESSNPSVSRQWPNVFWRLDRARYAALANRSYSANSAGRLRTTLKFISALDEHAGHSRLASLTQLQSRQSTARSSGIVDLFLREVIMSGPILWTPVERKPSTTAKLRPLPPMWQPAAFQVRPTRPAK